MNNTSLKLLKKNYFFLFPGVKFPPFAYPIIKEGERTLFWGLSGTSFRMTKRRFSQIFVTCHQLLYFTQLVVYFACTINFATFCSRNCYIKMPIYIFLKQIL